VASFCHNNHDPLPIQTLLLLLTTTISTAAAANTTIAITIRSAAIFLFA
jgi:hypothetical protein